MTAGDVRGRSDAWIRETFRGPREAPWRDETPRFAWAPVIAVFAVSDIVRLGLIDLPNPSFAGDGIVYATATRIWLSGGDPWTVTAHAVQFGAPPTSLLPFVPFAWLDPMVTGRLFVGLGLLAAVLGLRLLRLPLWWLAFPPLLESIWQGGLDAFLPLALAIAPAMAPVFKIYGLVPLVGRPRALLGAAAIILVTAPFLPWTTFISDRAAILQNFRQNTIEVSAAAIPILFVPTAIAILSMGWRGLYVAVSALLPLNQLQYGSMAVGTLRPVAAIGLAIWLPGAAAIGVILDALIGRLHRKSATHQRKPLIAER